MVAVSVGGGAKKNYYARSTATSQRLPTAPRRRSYLSLGSIIIAFLGLSTTAVAGRYFLFSNFRKPLGSSISFWNRVVGSKTMSTTNSNPMAAQPYKLLEKQRLSPDSFLLKYEILGRSILGRNPEIPTCVKVDYADGTDAKTGEKKTLSKSYSPVSHPNTKGTFDLIVKSYPLQPGGGVGKYLCDMEVGQSITGTLKKERQMHGSPEFVGRWKHIGLIAGGTGIAPLLQLARISLDSDTDTKIHLLFINRHKHDILGHAMVDQIARDHPDRFVVTYSLTGDEAAAEYEQGRGTVELARKALPPPTAESAMVFVCGKDGFVAHWGGPVVRGPKKPDGSKGPKIQGPLLGVLQEAGYTAEQVFKY